LYFANASIRPSHLESPDTFIDILSMVKESAVSHAIFSKSFLLSSFARVFKKISKPGGKSCFHF
jgi:hypothetical protein